ncbi:methyltransferase [Candidatus Pelagibacter sp. Uisw_092]|jgi:release factor glutamine methyltransferase|uniref:methyltransferase n=1 Tax=Candidatus Pelagibacter sp. Uisw_092 TaxID=3230979 RepID=UPI0039E83A86
MGKLTKFFWNTLESLNFLSKIIFKNKIHYKLWDGTWDLTSLVLKKTLDKHFKKSFKNYLDIGCGHVALFGQYVKKKYPKTKVTSSEKYPRVIISARKNILANKHQIKLVRSNLFENINSKFDLITANLPYVPKKIKHNIKKGSVRYNSRYSGEDGTRLSKIFLKSAHKYLNKKGKIFFGVNCFYISQIKCLQMINHYKYRVIKIVSKNFNSAKVFIIEKK